MSKISLSPNASGTGNFTIASPNSSTDRTLTLPDATGTINTSGAVNEVPAGTASAPSIFPTGDTNTGIFFPAADTIAFAEGGAEAMRIDSSGNVGIGTTSPVTSYRLSIYDQTNGATNISGLALIEPGSATSYSYFKTTSQASADTRTIIGNGAASRAFAFETGGTERMRIDSSGNVLVAKTSTSDTTKGIQLLASGRITSTMTESANGTDNLTVYSTGASAYRFYVGMGGTIYATSTTITGISDVRLKENIRDLDDGLDTVLALKPRKFDWKEGKGKDIKNDRGFIAQEFEEVLPDLIDEWKDPAPEGEEPYKSVRADLIPTLVKAIQEQQTIIETLKADIAELKAKVNV